MTAAFTVPGRPVPKARPRVTAHGTYTPQSTREYEQRVRRAWQLAGSKTFAPGKPLAVAVVAGFPIPASLSEKRRAAMNGTPHVKRGDLDNVVKAVLDALNGRAFVDDSLVWHIYAAKRWSPAPFTSVVISDRVPPEAEARKEEET